MIAWTRLENYGNRLVSSCERVQRPVLAGLLLVTFNYTITTVAHAIAHAFLWSLLTFHAPPSLIDQARFLTTRAWELSFATPMDWVYGQYRFSMMNERVDVVVAHYKEDLSWLTPYLSRIDHLYLYCKDSPSCLKGLNKDLRGAQLVVKHLPNEGREANSYLTHMISHYDEFPRRTVFTLASMKYNWARQLTFLLALTESNSPPAKHVVSQRTIDGIRRFYFHARTVVALSLGDGYRNARDNVIVTTPMQPLNKWMNYRFSQDLLAQGYRCGEGQHGAIFSTDGARIRRFSKSLYVDLLKDNSGADSMEVGYYMERLWRFMYAGSKRD